MAYTGKTTFTIDGTIIHIPFNGKYFPSLSSKWLNNLVKKYDQLQLIVWNEISLIGEKYWSLIKINQMYPHQFFWKSWCNHH